jgi:hypothetical protein
MELYLCHGGVLLPCHFQAKVFDPELKVEGLPHALGSEDGVVFKERDEERCRVSGARLAVACGPGSDRWLGHVENVSTAVELYVGCGYSGVV